MKVNIQVKIEGYISLCRDLDYLEDPHGPLVVCEEQFNSRFVFHLFDFSDNLWAGLWHKVLFQAWRLAVMPTLIKIKLAFIEFILQSGTKHGHRYAVIKDINRGSAAPSQHLPKFLGKVNLKFKGLKYKYKSKLV